MLEQLKEAFNLSRESGKTVWVIWVPERARHDPESGYCCGHYAVTIDPELPSVKYVVELRTIEDGLSQ